MMQMWASCMTEYSMAELFEITTNQDLKDARELHVYVNN